MAIGLSETGARGGSSGEWGLPNAVPGAAAAAYAGSGMYRRADQTGDTPSAVVHRRRVTHEIRMTVAPTTTDR